MNGDHEQRLRQIEREEWMEAGRRAERARIRSERWRIVKWIVAIAGSPLLVKLGAWISRLWSGQPRH